MVLSFAIATADDRRTFCDMRSAIFCDSIETSVAMYLPNLVVAGCNSSVLVFAFVTDLVFTFVWLILLRVWSSVYLINLVVIFVWRLFYTMNLENTVANTTWHTHTRLTMARLGLMYLSIEIPDPSPPPPNPGPRWGFDLTSLQILTNPHPTGAYWLVKTPTFQTV